MRVSFTEMAEADFSTTEDHLVCSICRHTLQDPVTTPCGHNFCKVCINSSWDKEDQRKIFSCPQCWKTFNPRPVLLRNTLLVEVLKKGIKTELQSTSGARRSAGRENVECDSCIGRKRKAVKSCLVCLVSFCEDHLQPHYESQAFKKHKLVETSEDLQEKICCEHGRAIELHCRTDHSFICCLCMLEKHSGHHVVTAKEERTFKQNQLKDTQMKFQQKIPEKQKKLQEVKQTMDTIKRHSQTAVDDNEKMFNKMIRSMRKRRSEVTEMIRAQEKADLSRAEQHQEHLEQEIADLKKRVSDLEQLSHTPDHMHFLQTFPSLCESPGSGNSSDFTFIHHLSFDGVKKSVSDLKKQVEEICQREFTKILPQATAFPTILPSKSKDRDVFMRHFVHLTLDPNTAHKQLLLSENKRVVTRGKESQRYSDHPERFESKAQVLCKESVCGRGYWEVEWRGIGVDISVSYKSVERKGDGDECVFGRNAQSWSLWCSPSKVSFWHDNKKTKLKGPVSSRIGVFVDHREGILSFYSVSDTMELLQRVYATFTQPLYAAFRVCHYYSAVCLCD